MNPSTSVTSVVPPIPSEYKPQPADIMRPVKASEIPMSVVEVENLIDFRSVWINNIPPETHRLALVLYMEQFGDVEACKINTSKSCYFTRWAKISFTSEEAAKRATEYFLHPFQGRYLFVLACNRCIDEVPGKVFVLDYLSKYLVYEDVAKSFEHAGEVFYLKRQFDNTYKVRIFFLCKVDEEAVLAVKSIGGRPINVEPFTAGMDLQLPTNVAAQLMLERDVMDPQKEARMAKIIEIYKDEALDRCDPVVNPDGKSEGNVVIISNVYNKTTERQIRRFFRSIGDPTSIHREKEVFNKDRQRIFVEFRTLSMVLKATELPADMTLNGSKPFIFVAWTKPRMTPENTVRLFFASKEFTVQDIYDGMIHLGKIRYIEKPRPKQALVVFDGHDFGINRCKVYKGLHIGPVLCVGKSKYADLLSNKLKKKGIYNRQSRQLLKNRGTVSATNEEKLQMKKVMSENENQVIMQKKMISNLETLLHQERAKRGERGPYVFIASSPAEIPAKVEDMQSKDSDVIDDEDPDMIDDEDSDEDDVDEILNSCPIKNIQSNQNKKQPNEKNQPNQNNPLSKQQKHRERRRRRRQTRKAERRGPSYLQQQELHRQQQQEEERRGPPHQQQQQQQQQERSGPSHLQHQQRPKLQQQEEEERKGSPYQQQKQHQQISGKDRNRSPCADNSLPQRYHPYEPQQDQRRSRNRWEDQDSQGPIWNDLQEQQLSQRQHDQLMPDDRFNRFDQMMPQQQLGNSSMNQQYDRDDPNTDFGRDSPGIPPNIPVDEIDGYIMRKREAIKRRLEQLDKQLAERSRHRDFEQAQRRDHQQQQHFNRSSPPRQRSPFGRDRALRRNDQEDNFTGGAGSRRESVKRHERDGQQKPRRKTKKVCDICGIKGHVKRHCPKLKNMIMAQ